AGRRAEDSRRGSPGDADRPRGVVAGSLQHSAKPAAESRGGGSETGRAGARRAGGPEASASHETDPRLAGGAHSRQAEAERDQTDATRRRRIASSRAAPSVRD